MCRNIQEGTEAQPQAHRNIHTFLHHPLFYTSIHTHAHTEVDRKAVGAPAGTCRSNELVIFSGRDKSFPHSVVNSAFSECGPVCHRTLTQFVCSESRRMEKQSLYGLSPKRESPGSVTGSQRPAELCVKEPGWMPPSPVGQVIPCGYRENTTHFVVRHKHPTISASLKCLVRWSYY